MLKLRLQKSKPAFSLGGGKCMRDWPMDLIDEAPKYKSAL